MGAAAGSETGDIVGFSEGAWVGVEAVGKLVELCAGIWVGV